MYQNFDVQGGPQYGTRNLPKLRHQLVSLGLDGFLIPHEDEYNNEYLPDCNERLMWISGFTGSAGAAIVMADKAAVFVDGRYTLQVRSQVNEALFSYEQLEGHGVAHWLAAHVTSGMKIGYDPRLHSPDSLNILAKATHKVGGTLVPVQTNPIDTAWDDRPDAPTAPFTIQPAELAGQEQAEKRALIGKLIQDKGADCAVITSPASIAWLLNIRGG
ncbi:MAG TPA: aminopeptidase P family protein, partial [Hellea balneolensis]|nr:aminopeptidase P family protein [Hellea balneolensis]